MDANRLTILRTGPSRHWLPDLYQSQVLLTTWLRRVRLLGIEGNPAWKIILNRHGLPFDRPVNSQRTSALVQGNQLVGDFSIGLRSALVMPDMGALRIDEAAPVTITRWQNNRHDGRRRTGISHVTRGVT